MEFLTHSSIFLFSILIVWFFAGLLITSIGRVARKLHKTGFTVAFFVLGLLTSVSEISVAVNSSIDGVPQVSAGNLIGSSFVLLLFLVPLLAIVGKGIRLTNTLSRKSLGFALLTVLFPVLSSLDGRVSVREGLLMLLAYATLIAFVRKDIKAKPNQLEKAVEKLETDLTQKKHPGFADWLKIVLGAAAIFFAAHLLVEEAVYFAGYFSVSTSLIGLLLLSIGTNVPEIVVAVRSVMKRSKNIAFGNYMGSAVANTLVFGALPIINGGFTLQLASFGKIALLLFTGLIFFFFFGTSKQRLSRIEGVALLAFYLVFLVMQF